MATNLFNEPVPDKAQKLFRGGRGCEYCNLNKVPGLRKIKGLIHIKQRRVMVWAMCPGTVENNKGLALIGPSGQLLWETCAEVGITRDMCDIQNVVRCMVADNSPTKHHLYCCSIYNEEALALNQSTAQVHLILGDVAGYQLLGADFHKDNPIFWHAPWNAYVVLAVHPSFLLHLNTGKSGWHYLTFRDRISAVASILQYPGRWGYVMAQDYGAVDTPEQMHELKDWLKSESEAGRNISVDIETGLVKDRQRALVLGFGWGHYEGAVAPENWRGGARSVVLYHPEADPSPKRLKPILKDLKEIIEDPSIKKTLQNGNFDDAELQDLLGMKLQGYDFDTRYGSYFKNSNSKQGYSLPVQIRQNLMEFADYKTGMTAGYENYADIPLGQLVTYNCADNDVTKRLECWAAPVVNKALLQIYIHCGYVLEAMQKRGPILDWKKHEEISALVDPQLESLRTAFVGLSGKSDFNPGSPLQISWLLFDHFQIPETEGRTTNADVLEPLIPRLANKQQKAAVRLAIQFRALSTIKGTFLLGYAASAKMHEDELRTIWWLCLAEGELVQTDRGYIPVESIKAGRRVLTHKGRLRRVSHVHYNGEHPIVRVTLENGLSLRTTQNHPYLVGDEWVPAEDLKVGQYVTTYGSPERWKAIPGHFPYKASTWGRIASSITGTVLKFSPKDVWGHLTCHLDNKTFSVARLIAKTFLPSPTKKRLVLHENGHPWDNNIENLTWGSTIDNHRDAQRHGTRRKNAKVTEEIVSYIRSLPHHHGFDSRVARELGISRETIRDIRKLRSHNVAFEGKRIHFDKSKIAAIEFQAARPTFGLTVEDDYSHVTAGIVTHNTGAVTGRLRSGGGKDADERRGIVNLQNIHGNQIIQNMLVSDKAWRQSLDFRIEDLLDLRVALKFDYSQIEIRMLAEVSGDPLLIKQFNATPIPGKPWLSDVHCLVGHELIGWDPQKIKEDKDLRVAIKGFHFALVYGVGKEGIYDHMVSESAKFGIKLSVTKKQVEQFYDKYFERYAGVATLMRKLRRQAETKRYVETLFGFRREIRQDDESRSTFWGNQAVNSPIQGTAHNLVLMAMALLHIKPGVYSLLQEPFMEVHDALYFFVKLRDLAEAYRNGLQLLQRDVANYAAEHFNRKLRVPLVAEAAAGFCLGSMPDYQGEPPEKFIVSFREKYWKTEKSEDYLKELQPIGRKLSRPV